MPEAPGRDLLPPPVCPSFWPYLRNLTEEIPAAVLNRSFLPMGTPGWRLGVQEAGWQQVWGGSCLLRLLKCFL